MTKYIFLISILVISYSCKNRNRNIDVTVDFTGEGYGEFEMCFKEENKPLKNFQSLYYHLYVTTKNGVKRERENVIVGSCINTDLIQYKLGTYSESEMNQMHTEFVNSNIEQLKIEIYYKGEHKTPFLTKELNPSN